MDTMEEPVNENISMTPEMIDTYKKLLSDNEKRKECQRRYMQRRRQEKKDEINAYKREHYRKKKLENSEKSTSSN